MDTKSATRWRFGNRFNTASTKYSLDNQHERQQQRLKTSERRLAGKHHAVSVTRLVSLGFSVLFLAYLSWFKISIEGLNVDGTSDGAVHPEIDADGFERREEWMPNSEHGLTKLRSIDREQYTIRMNTWRRPAQLVQSIKHHVSCPGVKQIQVVWCDKENDPPSELLEMIETNKLSNKVVIERHEANSLNERFNILVPTPTLGILSIDDDVLRPCEAIDSGFFKWVKSPHRMVGFDARTHVENDDGSWEYGYLSATKKENVYSMSLTRFCFVHRDYMNQYTRELPRKILETVAKNFNCEDIAMSLMISSQTQGQPPLLADVWAMHSQMKLKVETGISGTNTHKSLRDRCMDDFAAFFGLKEKSNGNRLQKATWIRDTKTWAFACGAREDDKSDSSYTKSTREEQLLETWQALRSSESNEYVNKYVSRLMYQAGKDAVDSGLLTFKKSKL